MKVVLFTASKVCRDPVEYEILIPNEMRLTGNPPTTPEPCKTERRTLKTFQIRRYLKAAPQDVYAVYDRFNSEFGAHGEVEVRPDSPGAVVFGSLNVAFDSPVVEEWMTSTQKKNEELTCTVISLRSDLAERNISLDRLRSRWYGRLALWMSGRAK